MSERNKQKSLTFIDLFAGAGGLSEGFVQAGFTPVAHVEMNDFAAQTLVTRSAYYYLKQNGKEKLYYDYLRGSVSRDKLLESIPKSIQSTVICETMSETTLPGIFKTIDGILTIRGIKKVDVIIGGPPCQAYSLVGRAQSSHMEVPMSEDPRNELYKLYARFLKKYQPRMFVFENVMGIESEQTKCLYGRTRTSQFPPNGFEIGDSFFIREIPIKENPFRQYVGVCAQGQSVKTALEYYQKNHKR